MASSVGATSSSIKCTNCIDELQSTYIECAECGDVDDQMQKVYLCVTVSRLFRMEKKVILVRFQCFSLGAECGTHRRTHDYRVHCPNGVPVFDYVTGDTSLWSSSEEQALVSAAEKYNLGNWLVVGTSDIYVCAMDLGMMLLSRSILNDVSSR